MNNINSDGAAYLGLHGQQHQQEIAFQQADIQENPNFSVGLNTPQHIFGNSNHGNHYKEPSDQPLAWNFTQTKQGDGNAGQQRIDSSFRPGIEMNMKNPPISISGQTNNLNSHSMSSNPLLMQNMIPHNAQINLAQQQQHYQMRNQQMLRNHANLSGHIIGNRFSEMSGQNLSTEQKLAQDKSLIENIERQLAQHSNKSSERTTSKRGEDPSDNSEIQRQNPMMHNSLNPTQHFQGYEQNLNSIQNTSGSSQFSENSHPSQNILSSTSAPSDINMTNSINEEKIRMGMNNDSIEKLKDQITPIPLDHIQSKSLHQIPSTNLSNRTSNSPVIPAEGLSSRNASSLTWKWQSDGDLPDRKRVLLGIMEIIKNVQDGVKEDPEKLSRMAKRLEEYLYNNAESKENYANLNTLKPRLQMVARFSGGGNPENNKSVDTAMSETAHRRINILKQRKFGAMDAFNSQRKDYEASQQKLMQKQLSNAQTHVQQQQILNQYQFHPNQHNMNLNQSQRNNSNSSIQNDAMINNDTTNNAALMLHEASNQRDSNVNQFQLNTNGASQRQTSESAPPREPIPRDSEKSNRIIRNQMKRLILLRHASKCSKGIVCTVKHCFQMKNLWNHMKICRDKNCTTEHCLSSRCVLNHYRICKEKNRARHCEVCAPVTKIEEQQNAEGGNFDDDLSLQSSLADADVNDFLMPHPLLRPTSAKTTAGEKVLTLAELNTEQEKLDQQKQFLHRLQEQQEMQLHHHRMSNIPQDSEQGLKLQKQQLLIHKCQQQFWEDQRLLKNLIKKRHSETATKNKDDFSKAPQTPHHDPLLAFSDPLNNHSLDISSNSLSIRKQPPDDLSMVQTTKKMKTDHQASSNKFDFSNSEEIKTNQQWQNINQNDPANDVNQVILKKILVSEQFLPLVSSLIEHDYAWIFKDPVDPVELGLPDYYEVIETPMYLNLVKQRLIDRQYEHVDNVCRDANLVFDNAILYNGEDSDVGKMALEMSKIFKEGCAKLLNSSSNGRTQSGF